MHPDLEQILLTKGEIRHFMGMDSFRYNCCVYLAILAILVDTPEFERRGELNCAIQAFGDRNISVILETAFQITLKIVNALGLSPGILKKSRNNPINLLLDVKNHNKIVNQIGVLDELQSVGNQVSLADRDNVIQALRITRENLVLALKTDKILRENPGFKPQNFSVDLTSLRSLQVSETSSEYAALFNETLQIGINIQEDIEQGLFRSQE